MAFGDPNSTMGTIVPRAMLLKAGITLSDLEHYHHYDGHTNVALAVLTGDADAGALKQEVFMEYADRGLKSLQQTPAISEHVFIASSELEGHKVRRIRELLLGINTPEQVEHILKPLKGSATGLVTASEADYLPLRRLMEKLDH
jgi:phosphonate transport system substrate-binding protein